MVNFINSINDAFNRYFNSLEAVGFQRDSETYKLISALFILHCFESEDIFRNLTNEQLDKLNSILECLYYKSCVFRK